MAVAVGDNVPDVELRVLGDDGMPQSVQSSEILGAGKVVLFAVPGAFTPGCSMTHLPGFVNEAAQLSAKGVDTVACIAVNDAWVMGAWGEAHNAGDIVMLADGNGDFAAAMGLSMDASGFGLGSRSMRYALVIQDGVIQNLDVDEDGGIGVSSCEAVLERL